MRLARFVAHVAKLSSSPQMAAGARKSRRRIGEPAQRLPFVAHHRPDQNVPDRYSAKKSQSCHRTPRRAQDEHEGVVREIVRRRLGELREPFL